MPTAESNTADASTGLCDYYYCNNTTDYVFGVLLGGGSTSSAAAGAFYFYVTADLTDTDVYVGFRPMLISI